jgi:hypothetical protein
MLENRGASHSVIELAQRRKRTESPLPFLSCLTDFCYIDKECISRSEYPLSMVISDLAAGKLHWLLYQEQQSENRPLGVKIVSLTSGCNSPVYALEITETDPACEQENIKGIPFMWQAGEKEWIQGLKIDYDPVRRKFSLTHQHPPRMPDCPIA